MADSSPLGLSVSVVVYRRTSVSLPALDAVLAQSIRHVTDLPFCDRVIVVDNSPHPVFAWTASISFKVFYLHLSGANLGYAKGHNIARFLTSSPFHLVLNPDIVFLAEGTLLELLSALEADPSLAMIQPMLVDANGAGVQRLCRNNPTLLSQLGRGIAPVLYRRLLGRYDNWYEMVGIAYGDCPVESQYLSGCFMLCRRSCLDLVNWFDPRFFMYLEDADLTRRLSGVGRCLHEPRLRVGHVWAKGSHRSLRLKLVAIVSYIQYGCKWGFRII